MVCQGWVGIGKDTEHEAVEHIRALVGEDREQGILGKKRTVAGSLVRNGKHLGNLIDSGIALDSQGIITTMAIQPAQ